jgi:hypothetical protein
MNVPIDFESGKCSWFGGPADTGVQPDEGLALIEPPDLALWWFACLFLPEQPQGTTGLARRLNPDAFYAAMAWNYTQTSRAVLRKSFLKVTNPKTNAWILVRPADEGPAKWTNRLIDLSPGCLTALGLTTDDEVAVELIMP